jgi:hypothetical protein
MLRNHLAVLVTAQEIGTHCLRVLTHFLLFRASLERIQHYVGIEQEPKPIKAGTPPAFWPAGGGLRVESLSARYSLDGPKVLHGISFEVKSGERIAIGKFPMHFILPLTEDEGTSWAHRIGQGRNLSVQVHRLTKFNEVIVDARTVEMHIHRGFCVLRWYPHHISQLGCIEIQRYDNPSNGDFLDFQRLFIPVTPWFCSPNSSAERSDKISIPLVSILTHT